VYPDRPELQTNPAGPETGSVGRTKAPRKRCAGPRGHGTTPASAAGQLPQLLVKTGIDVETVEIDPVIENMARQQFGFSLDKGSVHITDGRLYLNQTTDTYNYVFIDAFNADQIAWHLVSKQALETVRSRLKTGGLLVINITSISPGRDISSLQATLAAVFGYVRVFDEDPETELTNIVFLASEKPVELEANNAALTMAGRANISRYLAGEIETFNDGIVLSDEYNPIAYFRESAQLQWRKEMRDFLGEEYYKLVFL